MVPESAARTPRLTRRELFRKGFFASFLAVLGAGGRSADVPGGEEELQMGVLVDLTRCIGCRACENTCRMRWGEPGLAPAATGTGFGAGEGRLSFHTRTYVDFPYAGDAPNTDPIPVKKQCMHCVEPACVSVCPVEALHKTPRGPVVYRESRCLGCRYCMVACPFQIPRYEWNSGLTPKVGKCDFCDDRIASGLAPACVAACPTGALKFGKRAAVLWEAKARRSAEPGRYTGLYGDTVVGGTSWIYLSDRPMERLGFRTDLPGYALPSLTWRALSKVPLVIVGVGLLMSAVFRWRSARGAHG